MLLLSAFFSAVDVSYQRAYLNFITQDWNLARIRQKKIQTTTTHVLVRSIHTL